MKGRRVLVVDDDPISLEVSRERLLAMGYDVEIRHDALGTSQWILKNRPDVVLLDVMMPTLGGIELAQLLHRLQLETRIILHSSKTEDELQRLSRAPGVAGGIRKGEDDVTFQRQFERLVGNQKSRMVQ